jgi:hypothetical protein
MSQFVAWRRKRRTSTVRSRRNAGQAEVPGKTTKTLKLNSSFFG